MLNKHWLIACIVLISKNGVQTSREKDVLTLTKQEYYLA